MAKSITYIGLDVHKDTIAVALAETGLRGGSARVWEDPEYTRCLEGAVYEAGTYGETSAVLL